MRVVNGRRRYFAWTRTDRARAAQAAGAVAIVAVASASAGSLSLDPRGLRVVLAGALALLVLSIGAATPEKILYALVVWLAALGLTRRLVSELGDPGELDPLLLVSPFAIVVLLGATRAAGAFARRSVLANLVLLLSLLFVLGALNPLQGTLLGGLAGLLFVLMPTLAFWIGRSFCDDRTLRRVLGIVVALAPFAAVYGLLQTFVGFPGWDQAWIERSGYTALNVAGGIRGFSSFPSSSEYATFLALALVVCVAFGMRSARTLVTVPLVGLLATAIFLQASRGIIVLLVPTLVLLFCVRAGVRLVVSLALVVVSLFLLTQAAAYFIPDPHDRGFVTSLVRHQTEALANPLESKSSTVPIHLKLAETGFRSALKEPLGLGVSTISLAGKRFGGVSASTETDPSNTAVALGLPGLLAYAALVVAAFGAAYRLAGRRRDPLALAALGVLAVTLFQWLNGGQYAVAFLVWLVLGWVDRSRAVTGENDDVAPARAMQ